MGKSNTDVSRKPHQSLASNDSQFIDQAIQTKLSDQFRPYYLISGMLFIFTLLEWYRWHEMLPPVPFAMSVLFLISVVIAYFKQRQFRQEIGFLHYGKQGEQLVSEYIRDISTEYNIRVFQNVRIENVLCSYVICAKFGVMLINIVDLPTPDNGEAIITCKNNKLTLNGYSMDQDPVYELKRSCVKLQELLQKSSNKKFTIHGVLVFPNWYVRPHENADIKIINPRQLADVYYDLSKTAKNDEQCLAAYHLNKFTRQK